MSLLYCKLHEQAFDRARNAWRHFLRKDLLPLQHLYNWLRSADIDFPEYAVVETPCAQCDLPSHEKYTECV